MNIVTEVLEKEIERRTILLGVETNVLIQNDMSNEITELKNALVKFNISGVGVRSEQFYCVGHKKNPCKDVNNQCEHCKILEKFWEQ